ncbi:polyprenyl synthetase family protein [Saliterribacillus persicus]|uniref:Farnesyl diphosphate synthase n=1 Tax=Saliterribacillus persicus TaxID=930114 RepID=A0A368XHC3_9BACI|nr:farnesyl diphosphate synthase [Saliterribacillus persicus]RCW65414.1 farnesyl-diphosphate synthase [Saliterribacillus persicus]
MKDNLTIFIKDTQKTINEKLMLYLDTLSMPFRLKESLYYSIEAGGKRLRPILMLATSNAFKGNDNKIYPAAMALEMIHTYSLIHDDLPAMDDDDYRRGKLTNHKKFDDATAILAGDGLLTESFRLIANSNEYTDEQKVYIISKLSEAAGVSGMVAGQILDIEAEAKNISIDELEKIHLLKTGKLFIFAMEIGAYLTDLNPSDRDLIKEFATKLGLIFQIQDDILDVIGDEAKIGKPVGSDQEKAKNTFPKILGIDETVAQKKRYQREAISILEKLNVEKSILIEFVHLFSDRDN